MHQLKAKFASLSEELRGNGFEFAIERVIGAFCLPGNVVIDAGANFGLHTYNLLQAVGSTGKVIAVEADPVLAMRLRDQWGPIHPNLMIIEAALMDRVGEVEFGVASQKGYGSILNRPHFDVCVERTITVSATTIDCIISAEPGRVTFIKADVEGAELLLINGATLTLKSHRPLIAVEVDWNLHFDKKPETEREFFAHLSSLDYVVYDLFGNVLSASSPSDYVVLLAPREQFDGARLAAVTQKAFAEFIEDPTWNLQRKFATT